MKLIVGLGNPGLQYKWTRHNVGFEVLDKLAYDQNLDLNKNKFKAIYADKVLNGEKIIFVKPLTYMNLSGECVRDFLNFYKGLTHKDIIIVCDDINLPIGSIRIKPKGSSGGQNGLKNIIYHLETEDFVRIRVGIGGKPEGFSLSNFVLSKFTKEEETCIIAGITDATEAIEMILKENGLCQAMNKFNKKLN